MIRSRSVAFMGGRYDDRLGNRIMPEMAARTSLKSHARANKSSTKLEFCKRLLFDEIERKTHAAINADAFRALQADRDAARTELEKAKAWAADTIREMDAMRGERDSLRAMVEKMNAPGERAETTYLNIIGAMLALMLGKSPNGQAYSVLDNQSAIIAALLGHHGGKPGISARTLEDKFAAAKRSLTAT